MTTSNEFITKSANRAFDFFAALSILWHQRTLLAKFVGVAAVASLAISLALPKYFRSSATLLPKTERDQLVGFGGLSNLASLAGVSIGDVSIEQLFPEIVRSESILKDVIFKKYEVTESKSMDLIQYWEINEKSNMREYELAVEKLRGELQVSVDAKTKVITLSISTKHPELSAAIINACIERLDDFLRTKQTTNASEQRKWIETRLSDVRKDLERLENAFNEFREKNRRISDSPLLLLEEARFMREIEINSTLYIELKKQHELARIEEIKSVPIINVMDYARASAEKESPKRILIVLSSIFASGFVVALVILVAHFGKEGLEKIKTILGLTWFSVSRERAE